MALQKKLLGYCGVDSGQLIVADPCYFRSWKDGDVEFEDGKVKNAQENHYAEACQATLGDDMGGEVLVSGIGGRGVAFSTGYGDGNYPVYATYKDGRVKSISIKFF